MPPMNLNVKIFGRPVKPVALGLTLVMLTLTVANLLDYGAMGDSRWGDVVAVVACTAGTFMSVAWVLNSQWMAEWGLLLSCSVFIVRGTYILLTSGWTTETVYLSAASAIIAGGSYFLERTDPRGTGGTP